MSISSNAIFQRWSDNAFKSATLTAIASGDATYTPANLVDDKPGKVAKINATTGGWKAAFAAPQRLDGIALIHHTFMAGCDVKIQGNTTSSFASPAFSASITIPAWLGSGATAWPVNPWLDLTSQPGYSASGFQYWQLLVTGNNQNVHLGQLVGWAQHRQLIDNYEWEYSDTSTNYGIDPGPTLFGIRDYRSLYSYQYAQKITVRSQDADADVLRAHWQDADGRFRPWLYIPDAYVNACYYVRWNMAQLPRTHTFLNDHLFELAIEEVQRGLRPGT